MELLNYIIALLFIVGSLYLLLRVGVGSYFKFRGKRLVTCPENRATAAVEVDARHAGVSATFGQLELRLQECSRWPERQNCDQRCLTQIEMAPEGCLLRNLITEWYTGKHCVICRRTIDNVDWLEQQPALLRSGEQFAVQWNAVPAEQLPAILHTAQPVCWNCFEAERFRREHPELVIDRPWREPVKVSEDRPPQDD
jgi:hypothetical protein